jgi:poly(A) polymerase
VTLFYRLSSPFPLEFMALFILLLYFYVRAAVAFCIQLYPNSSPSSLFRKFFLVFKTWRWPNPVMLTKPHDAKLGLLVWSPQQALIGIGMQRQVAPIITPAYPAMNST